MNLNFELILFYATVVTGVICLIDVLFFAKRREMNTPKGMAVRLPIIIDYARSFFPVLLIVFLLRSFLYEPFRIPSGSLEPTLTKGDFILVNKYNYGVRLPVVHKRLFGEGAPQRGDIIVFRWPPNPSFDFIKRVIGVPGDHIKYVNKELFINGEKISQESIQENIPVTEEGDMWEAHKYMENLLGVKHDIYVDPKKPAFDLQELTVPEGVYFVMGDNRDNSQDSRYWGFVPDGNVVGKAVMIWMSWNGTEHNIRWNRLGKGIH